VAARPRLPKPAAAEEGGSGVSETSAWDRAAPVPRVGAVVLNWNGGDMTLACLQSLARVEYPELDVVLVDNGSSDGSVERVRREHPGVDVVENGANLGFAAGNNVGIRRALARGAEMVLLLNNDAEATPGLVRELVTAAVCVPDAGMLGALVLLHDQPERVWYAGARWDPVAQRFEVRDCGKPLDEPCHGGIAETAFVPGCAMLVRAEVCRDVGLMDERYFLTWEEVDWCARARRAGWRSLVVGRARARHRVSASFGGDGAPLHRYFMERNRIRYIRAHMGRRAAGAAWARACMATLAELRPPPRRPERWGWRTPAQWLFRVGQAARERGARLEWRARVFALADAAIGRGGNCRAVVERLNAQWVAAGEAAPVGPWAPRRS
jgi:GT2 family glycosyltransferase